MPEPYQQQGMYHTSSKVIMTPSRWMLTTTAGKEQRKTRLFQMKQRSHGGGWQEVVKVMPPGMAKSKVFTSRKSSQQWPGQRPPIMHTHSKHLATK